MSLQNWQTVWQVVIALGVILGAIGGLGVFFVGRQIEQEDKQRTKVEETQISRAAFRKSIHFHKLTGHWIEVREGVYQVGLIAEILNKDNTRAHVIHEAAFTGTFQIGGPGGRFLLSTLVMSDASKSITGQYFLSPGGETKIKMILPSLVEMQILEGVPGLTFQGSWTFRVEDESIPLAPTETKMVSVTTLEKWERNSEVKFPRKSGQ